MIFTTNNRQHLETTTGIIIKIIPYKDSVSIVRIFTDGHGLIAGMVRLGKAKTSSLRHICRVMNLVEFESTMQDGRDLQHVNHLRLAYPMQSIPFDAVKSAIVLYIGELLSKTLPDQYHNRPLFKFLHDALLLLDDSEQIQNFHLWCTTEIIRHYGFYPEKSHENIHFTCFDFLENTFASQYPAHPYYLNLEESSLLWILLDKDWSEVQTIPAGGSVRKGLLDGLLQMINLQLDLRVSYLSLDVLHQVFHE
jgi:DNA repair protein RecO (recombination protein O)